MRKKVALIGPVAPFRGGVAQYTTQLHEALSTQADLTTISFKRQYPQWLYPGNGDRDDSMKSIQGVRYIIDVYNPLSWRKAANEIAKEGCEVAVLDWWTLFWQPGFAYIARRLRKKGVKTVFLCHNLVNHKTGGLMGLIDKVMYPTVLWMLKQSDGYILQSSDQVSFIKELKPNAQILKRIHPIYDRFPAVKNPKKPRGKLDLLFFGFIRPYKGLPFLMEALKQLDDKDIYLTVVGESWQDADETRQELEAYNLPNLELNLAYADDEKVGEYITRSDAVVLPYLSATGSGVVAVAYNYGTPVIATKVGGLKDAVIDEKTGWLVGPEDSSALAKKISDISRVVCQKMAPNIANFCKENSWDSMAQAILHEFTNK